MPCLVTIPPISFVYIQYKIGPSPNSCPPWIMWPMLDSVAHPGWCGLPWILWPMLDSVAHPVWCGLPWILWLMLDSVAHLVWCGLPWILWPMLDSVARPGWCGPYWNNHCVQPDSHIIRHNLHFPVVGQRSTKGQQSAHPGHHVPVGGRCHEPPLQRQVCTT